MQPAARLAALFVLVLAATTAPTHAQSGRSWMNGLVVDESDTHGIPGATVELRGDPTSERLRDVRLVATTDARGHYELSRVPYGDYTFRVSAPGRVAYAVPLYVLSDALTALHVKLRREPAAPAPTLH